MQELQQLLDTLDGAAADRDRVAVGDVCARLGENAFGPALLVLGLLALSPLGDIPGMPSIMSVLIVLVGGQFALGRDTFWLPERLRRRSVKSDHLRRAVRVLRPVARFAGKVVYRRLPALVTGTGARVIGAACALLALTLPPLEFVPFAATAPSSAITVLSLALVAQDGLLALLAAALTVAAAYLVVTQAAGLA